ncbi:MAG TPA: efflux RND transporter periplasmic adaptor subunit [Xanthobacteraceae bacterium]
MRRWLLAFLVVAAAAVVGGRYFLDFSANTAENAYRLVRVDRGSILASVNSTGTINPITTVIVSSQLSGQVVEILADYNSEVKAEQVVARLNSDQIRARLDAARADLEQSRAQKLVTEAQIDRAGSEIERAKSIEADARAQIDRAEALLADAERLLQRQSELQSRGFAATAALDTARTQRDAQRAAAAQARAALSGAIAQQRTLAADQKMAQAQQATVGAQILQREAVVRQIEVDLRNTEIKSPVSGVVIQRNIELGQTVAASLQAPTLFLIADDLRRMEIAANVDEADVGNVRDGQRATFTVNAFPSRTFEGRVKQVRLGSQTVQNVVIYTAIISVENPRLELRPGMTANLRIETERRDDVLRVPNAALRWRPPTQQPDATVTSPLPLDPAPRGPSDTASGGRRAMQEYVAAIRGELGLAAEQQRALDALLAEQRRGFGGLAAEPDPVERRAKFVEMRRGLESSIAELLTPEQQTKFRAIVDRFTPGSGTREGQAGRVYVVGSDGKPQQIALRLGATDGSVTEVMAGQLEATREVIVGGGQREAPRTPPRFGF